MLGSESQRRVFEVHRGSNTPVHAQIVSSVITAIERGGVAAGDKLPSIRRLAADLEVAPGTVARAYRYLEQCGVVVTHRARGTVVLGGIPAPERLARAAAEQFLSTMVEELEFTVQGALEYAARFAGERYRD